MPCQFECAGPRAFGIELAAGFLKRPQRATCENDAVSIFKKQPGGFESESAIGSGDQGGFLLHVGKSSVVVDAGIKPGKSLSQDLGGSDLGDSESVSPASLPEQPRQVSSRWRIEIGHAALQHLRQHQQLGIGAARLAQTRPAHPDPP
jgi:hypothetical protein